MRPFPAPCALAAASLLLVAACTVRDPPPGQGLADLLIPDPGRGPPRRARVTITWVAPRPTVGSGVVTSWYKFTGRRTDGRGLGRELAYFSIYLGDRDVLPVAGESCDLVYRFGPINGFGVGGNGLIPRGRIATGLACGPAA